MFLTKLKTLAMLGLVGGVAATGAGVLAQVPALAPMRAAENPGGVSSAAPSDDRLQALEIKLDRLLNLLDPSGAKTSPGAGDSSQDGSVPPTAPRAKAVQPGGMPGTEGIITAKKWTKEDRRNRKHDDVIIEGLPGELVRIVVNIPGKEPRIVVVKPKPNAGLELVTDRDDKIPHTAEQGIILHLRDVSGQ